MIEKTLLISLFVVEIIAFAWLIMEAKHSRKQRETILDVEKQILSLEKTIISMERTLIKKVNKINDLVYKKELIKNGKKRKKNTSTHKTLHQ